MKTKLFKKLFAIFCTVILLFSAAGCGESCNGADNAPFSFAFNTFEDFYDFCAEFAETRKKDVFFFNLSKNPKASYNYGISCPTIYCSSFEKNKVTRAKLLKYISKTNTVTFDYVGGFNSNYFSNGEYDKSQNGYCIMMFYEAKENNYEFDINEITFRLENTTFYSVNNCDFYEYRYNCLIGEDLIIENLSIYFNEKDDVYEKEVLQMLKENLVVLKPNK